MSIETISFSSESSFTLDEEFKKIKNQLPLTKDGRQYTYFEDETEKHTLFIFCDDSRIGKLSLENSGITSNRTITFPPVLKSLVDEIITSIAMPITNKKSETTQNESKIKIFYWNLKQFIDRRVRPHVSLIMNKFHQIGQNKNEINLSDLDIQRLLKKQSPISFDHIDQNKNKINNSNIAFEFIEMPIETQSKIVGQKEKWLINVNDSANITKVDEAYFQSLTREELKAVFTNSPNLMIEVVYNQESYLVSAKKLFESKVLDISVFGNYQSRKITCDSGQLKLIIDDVDGFVELPYLLLSLQAQRTDFEKWSLLSLLAAYSASNYYDNENMKKDLLPIIRDRTTYIYDVNIFFRYFPSFTYDKDILVELIEKNSLALQFASPEFQNDPTIVIPAIEKNSLALQFASPEFQNNPKIVLAAVLQNGLAFQFASPELQNNLKIVLAAVLQNGLAFQFASPELQNDPITAGTAVNQDGLALQFASPELQNDPTIVLAAVNQKGLALQFASPELQNDPTIVLAAVLQNGLALQFASPELQNDPTIVLAAVNQKGLALQFASPELQNDPTIVLAAVNQKGLALQFTSPELQNDPTIVLAAVNQKGLALQFASPELQNDPTIVLAAVNQKGLALQFTSPKLQNDPQIVKFAVQQNGLALQFTSPKLQKIPDIAFQAILQNKEASKYANLGLQYSSLTNELINIRDSILNDSIAGSFIFSVDDFLDSYFSPDKHHITDGDKKYLKDTLKNSPAISNKILKNTRSIFSGIYKKRI